MVKPYTEIVEENVKIRTFSETVDAKDLVWHRDRNDRQVTVVEGTGWMIQYDNQLPKLIEVGKPFFISAGEYHRLHKGNGSLKLKIKEMI